MITLLFQACALKIGAICKFVGPAVTESQLVSFYCWCFGDTILTAKANNLSQIQPGRGGSVGRVSDSGSRDFS